MKALMTPGEVGADREGWLALRRHGIGASEISQVLAICPAGWGTPRTLWDEKDTGVERPDRGNMKRGRKLEPFVIEEWDEAKPDVPLAPGGLYCHDDRPWQLATFDALTAFDGVPVQLKTAPNRHVWRNGLPDYYLAQAYWELDVADADRVYVAGLALEDWDLHIWEIRRTEGIETDLAFMRGEAEAFLASLESGDKPEVDWTPACTNMLKTLNPRDEMAPAARVPLDLARRRLAAYRAQKAAEKRLALVDNQIRERIGSAPRAVAWDKDTGQIETVVTRVVSTVAAHWRQESKRDFLRAGRWGTSGKREEQD